MCVYVREWCVCVCVMRVFRCLVRLLLTSIIKEMYVKRGTSSMGKDVQFKHTFAVKSLVFIHWFTLCDQIYYKTYSHIYEVNWEKVNTHKQGSGLKTDVLNQRQSTLVLISFLSSYIFVLNASCVFTMHLFSVLPCLVKT